MSLAHILPALQSALSAEITVREITPSEAQIYVPFYFPDGDGFVVHVRAAGDGLEITDKANTLLHLGYHTDVERLRDGTRASLLERIRSRHGLEDREGEFVLESSVGDVGASVYSFTQALIEISDLRNLDREIIRSTFREDLASLLHGAFPGIEIDYVDQTHDRQGLYPIPYVLNGTNRPIAVFDIGTDAAALQAIVLAQHHREWDSNKLFVAIEQDQQQLGRRHVSWLSDAFDKQFSTLAGNESAIVDYLRREWTVSQQLSQHA